MHSRIFKITMEANAHNHTGYGAIENVNTIEERRSKIDRNSVFHCHLSPHWKTLFLSIFYPRSSIVDSIFDCCLPIVIMNPDQTAPDQGPLLFAIFATKSTLTDERADTTMQLVKQYTCTPMKHLKISCQKHKIDRRMTI